MAGDRNKAKSKAKPALRVRHDPPTLAEAAIAASCLTDNLEHQAEIAAQLMGATLEEAQEAVRLQAVEAEREKRRIHIVPAVRPGDAGIARRPVVVERRPSRDFMTVPRPAVVRLTPR